MLQVNRILHNAGNDGQTGQVPYRVHHPHHLFEQPWAGWVPYPRITPPIDTQSFRQEALSGVVAQVRVRTMFIIRHESTWAKSKYVWPLKVLKAHKEPKFQFWRPCLPPPPPPTALAASAESATMQPGGQGARGREPSLPGQPQVRTRCNIIRCPRRPQSRPFMRSDHLTGPAQFARV